MQIVNTKGSCSPDHLLIVCLSQQYIYTDLAAKERAHYTPEADTPNMGLARKMKVVYSEVSLLSFCCGILCAVYRIINFI